MLWLGVLLLCCFAFVGAGVVAGSTWIHRHVRHPAVIGALALVVSIIAVPTSLTAALTPPDGSPWQPYVYGVEVLALISLVTLVLTMRRPLRFSDRPRRILVVAAHPDDLELACGGALARFVDHGHEVRAIVMSRGAEGGHAETRKNEALVGAETLDLAGISIREFTDTKMATEIEQMVNAVETAIDLFQPDVLMTHSQHDQHQDHHAVHLAMLRAGRRCPTILCFESPSVTTDFAPRYFVDISDYLDAKIASVRAHRDQANKPYMAAAHLRGAAAFRGSQAKVEHAEGFEVVRALSSGIGDL